MSAIIGMALFTQYYYWFPMIHFINLAVNPAVLVGIDSNLKIVKNYHLLSKAKPSLYGYPIEDTTTEKKKETKTETAVLSTHNRVRAKERKTGTVTLTEMAPQGGQSSKPSNSSFTELKPASDEKVPATDEGEKKEEKKVVEPKEEIIINPFRIIPRQRAVIEEIKDQDFEPIINGRLNGFVL